MHVSPLEHERLLTPEDSSFLRSRAVILQPGEEVGAHSTHGHEEVVIVLEGEITAIVDGEERTLAGGNALFVPPQTPHNIFNRSNAPAKYVYVRSR